MVLNVSEDHFDRYSGMQDYAIQKHEYLRAPAMAEVKRECRF